MKCLICNNNFYFKKSFKNLFEFDKSLICDKCLLDSTFQINVSIIPLKYKLLRVIDFNLDMFFSFEALTYELNFIYRFFLKEKKYIFILEHQTFSFDFYLFLEIATYLFDDNLEIICFSLS